MLNLSYRTIIHVLSVFFIFQIIRQNYNDDRYRSKERL
jgi:hypothetical protein